MHDRNNTLLLTGDIVMLPARVVALGGGDDFCNVQLETVYGRRPDGLRENLYSVNTGCVVLHERPAE